MFFQGDGYEYSEVHADIIRVWDKEKAFELVSEGVIGETTTQREYALLPTAYHELDPGEYLIRVFINWKFLQKVIAASLVLDSPHPHTL
jgi:hypothetical protein